MRTLRSAASVAASLALLIGVPWLLSETIGNPLDRVPDLLAGDVNDHVVLAALAAALYVAWAQFAVAFAVELISAVRRTPMPRRIPGIFAGQQGLARVLVSGALLLLPVTASTVVPAAQAVAMTPAHHPTATAVTGLLSGPSAESAHAAAPIVPTREVTVTSDAARTWWDLAVTHHGDGAKWRDLWYLNHGRVQADGTVLTSERVVLQPGWTILIPDTTATENTAEPPDVTSADDSRDVAVTVQPGDTLSEIAADHGVKDWTTVWPSNTGRDEPDGARFTDPDYIEPGWTVTIPTPTGTGDIGGGGPTERGDNAGDNAVQVSAGDTLSQLAADNQVPLDTVVAANIGRVQPDGSQLTDPDDIQPGWQILIPGDVTPAPGTATPSVSEPAPSTPLAPSTPVTPEPGAEMSPMAQDAGPSASAAPSPSPTVEPTTPFSPGQPAGTHGDDGAPATDRGAGEVDSGSTVPWIAGAGLLAGGALLALIRHRRRQFRYRTPGRSITRTPTELRDTERALLTGGANGMGDVTFLDRALRGLTRADGDGHGRLPNVLAARLTDDCLELTLTDPEHDAPEPWQSDETGTTWTLNRRDADPRDAGGAAPECYAPYPTLVSVGHTPTGEQWLLDLEQVGFLSLTGDIDRCMDLARFIAAELAHNAWSDTVDVTLVGFGPEMTVLNPERLTHTDNLQTAAAAATRALTDTRQDMDVTHRTVLEVRATPATGDVPTPHVTLIAPTAAPDDPADDALAAITDQLRGQHERSAVAVVLAGIDTGGNTDVDAGTGGGFVIRMDRDGTLHVPALGLRLIAQQLPRREAADLAALLALAAATDDQPMPTARGDQPWDDYADAAGNPLPQHTTTATNDTADPAAADESGTLAGSVSSALPLPPRAYLERTAADQTDLDTLAPRVPDDVRERIENSDTDLDADLADWYDDTTARPRVTVLGAIRVRAQGELPAGRPRLAWHTEVVTYLATRPRGATVEAFGTALWPGEPDITSRPKLRNSIYSARKWLGVDPSTGQDYLPSNTRLGGGAYRIVGGLLDAELFRRLRLRGVARGERGIPDLRAALNLVTGVPFDRQRPGGYGWLVDPALDHDYTAMIVDVAHLVATHHLAVGEPELAGDAAQVALLAGSSADSALLNLVAASEALGNTTEADAYVKRIMANHDADVEEDLPPRTAAILRRRRWLPPAA